MSKRWESKEITTSGVLTEEIIGQAAEQCLSDVGVVYEMHADGVKEVKREACKFCKPAPPCDNPWCPTQDEE